MKYMFSLVPQHSALKLVKKWTPLLARLGQLKGVNPDGLLSIFLAARFITRAKLHGTWANIKPRYVNSRYSVYLKVIKDRFATKGEIIRILKDRLKALRLQIKTMSLSRRRIAVFNRLPLAYVKLLINASHGPINPVQCRVLLTQINAKYPEASIDKDWNSFFTLGICSLSRSDY